MIQALALLLVLQLVGEVIATLSGFPVPGPVIGMVLLFLWLVVRGGADEALKNAGNGLLQNLSLLFIPAGAGILLHLHRLAEDWLPIALSVVISTLLTLVVAGLMIKLLARAPGQARD